MSGCRHPSATRLYASKPPAWSPRGSCERCSRISERTEERVADACLFCRIVRKEIPAQIVAESADCVAFRDINPQAPVHILVVPREHVASVADVTDPTMVGKMTSLAKDLAQR